MFDHIRKLLKELHPVGMSLVKLALAFQILKGFMITMDHKLLWKKVVLPILQSSNKSIKLFIIGGVVEMTPLDFLTKIHRTKLKQTANDGCTSTQPRRKLRKLPTTHAVDGSKLYTAPRWAPDDPAC